MTRDEGAWDAETSALVRDFEAATLEAFPHEAHLRVAWAYVRAHPLLEAVARMSEGLKRFAAAKGATGKYHETITWAFVFLVHDRMLAHDPPLQWPDFAEAHRDLFDRAVLERYYRSETLGSPLARRVFLLPEPRT